MSPLEDLAKLESRQLFVPGSDELPLLEPAGGRNRGDQEGLVCIAGSGVAWLSFPAEGRSRRIQPYLAVLEGSIETFGRLSPHDEHMKRSLTAPGLK